MKLISPSGSSIQMEFLKENIHRIQREAESGVMPQEIPASELPMNSLKLGHAPSAGPPYFGPPPGE